MSGPALPSAGRIKVLALLRVLSALCRRSGPTLCPPCSPPVPALQGPRPRPPACPPLPPRRRLPGGRLSQTADRGHSGSSPAVGRSQELQAGQVAADGGVMQGQGPLQGLQGGRVALPKQPLHQQRVPEAGGQVQRGDA